MMAQKQIRRWKRQLMRDKKKWAVLFLCLIALVAIVGYSGYMRHTLKAVDEASYKPLLTLIANAESRGNYNAYFGHTNNSTIDFTAMSIAEVLQWQEHYVQQGSPSSAVGRYQFLNTTLRGLVHSQAIDERQLFNKTMQDRLAVVLLNRRGGEAYVNQELSREQFAANIAKEWASMPRMVGNNPETSYYAHDGLNQALVKPEMVLRTIDKIQAR